MRRYLLALFVALTASLTMQAQEVSILYGYLKVFPNDLGTFDAEPRTVIARLNEQQQYGYGTWRLPTNEELQLMRGSNVIGDGSYMTKENKQGIVRLVTDKEAGETLHAIADGYVDLGLPSGTLWKEQNETGGFYTYEQALAKFGETLPSKEQLEELKNSCRWSWTGSGYMVEGPNGKTITLPAEGYCSCYGDVQFVGSEGYYWSSTLTDEKFGWNLYFDAKDLDMYMGYRCSGRSIRLVH